MGTNSNVFGLQILMEKESAIICFHLEIKEALLWKQLEITVMMPFT